MRLLRRHSGQHKPIMGTPINFGNPLAYSLVCAQFMNEGAGIPGNAVMPASALSTTGTHAWENSPYGPAFSCSGSNGAAVPARGLASSAVWTIAALARWTGTATNQYMFGWAYEIDNGNLGSLLVEGANIAFVLRDQGGSIVVPTGSTTVNDGQYRWFFATNSGSVLNLYAGRTFQATATPPGGSYSHRHAGTGGLYRGSWVAHFTGTVAAGLIFDRALTTGEMGSIIDDPWSLFAPPRSFAVFGQPGAAPTANRRRRFLMAAG
jgi:hypothetical protein